MLDPVVEETKKEERKWGILQYIPRMIFLRGFQLAFNSDVASS